MDLNKVHKIYFVGIGGIGMSALASFFASLGKTISGYDKTSTKLTQELESKGIVIQYNEDLVEDINSYDLVVKTAAIHDSFSVIKQFTLAGIPIIKRAKALGLLSGVLDCIAVAGTHGKTTTSAILAHLLYHSSVPMNAFVGGIMSNYNTNVLQTENPKLMVVEADEYDRSFMQLHPNYSIINSIDPDHLDIYQNHQDMIGSYQDFFKLNKDPSKVLVASHIHTYFPGAKTFGFGNKWDYNMLQYHLKGGQYQLEFDFAGQKFKAQLTSLAGEHNLLNTLAASAMAFLWGLSPSEIISGLASFKGIKRRFELVYLDENHCFINDYAHHPVEIKGAILAAKELYPDRKITVVFQPHLYSRTRDFAEEFALELSKVNELILLPIYPAREEPIEGVDSDMLLSKMPLKNKKLMSKKECTAYLKGNKPALLLFLGAGDLNLMIEPIIEGW